MGDEILSKLESVKKLIIEEQKEGEGSRELSLVATKTDEAIMWRLKDLSIKNESEKIKEIEDV